MRLVYASGSGRGSSVISNMAPPRLKRLAAGKRQTQKKVPKDEKYDYTYQKGETQKGKRIPPSNKDPWDFCQ